MRDSAAAAPSAAAFVRELRFDALPADVVACAQRCLLDLVGVAAGGASLPAARIAADFAVGHMAGTARHARILFDGRSAGIPGAAFAGAAAIDVLDAHDGHVLTKGHAGAAVLPALLAFSDGESCDGREFLACLVLGYEIATRAGIALHATVPDFHCSGAWNALGCAAIGARLLHLDDARVRACARHRGVLGTARPDHARVRVAVDGQGRVVVGRARRRDRGTARRRRIHRRARGHRRGCDRGVERSRHPLSHSRAVLQGVSRVPLGAACDRRRARVAPRARLRSGRHRVDCHRELPRGGRPRLAMPGAVDDGRGAIQPALSCRRRPGARRRRRT